MATAVLGFGDSSMGVFSATPMTSSEADSSHHHHGPSTSSPIPQQHPVRLSLKHGATLETIEAYMASLGSSLRRKVLFGFMDTWQPQTAPLSVHYSAGREIGRGHFGTVRLCTEFSTKETFACKTILKASIQKMEDVSELLAEVSIMLKLQSRTSTASEKLVRLHEVVEDEEALHLVMDYCSGGDLFDYVAHRKRLSEREKAQILKQIVVAVLHSHERCSVVHRDLKPENILLSKPVGAGGKPEIKVTDFGLCLELRDGAKARGVAGSPFYMAPEVIRGVPYSFEVDTWSIGVILYTCLAGCLPFWGQGHEAVFKAVLRASPDFSKSPWPLVSPEAKALIRRMLQPEPSRRISLRDVLVHSWMLRHCPELRVGEKYGNELQPRKPQQPGSFRRFHFGRGPCQLDALPSGLPSLLPVACPTQSPTAKVQEEDKETIRGGIRKALEGQQPGDTTGAPPATAPASAPMEIPSALKGDQAWATSTLMDSTMGGKGLSPEMSRILQSPPELHTITPGPVSEDSSPIIHSTRGGSSSNPRPTTVSPLPLLKRFQQAAASLAHPFESLYMPLGGSSGFSPVLAAFLPAVQPEGSKLTELDSSSETQHEQNSTEEQLATHQQSPAEVVLPGVTRDLSFLSLVNPELIDSVSQQPSEEGTWEAESAALGVPAEHQRLAKRAPSGDPLAFSPPGSSDPAKRMALQGA